MSKRLLEHITKCVNKNEKPYISRQLDKASQVKKENYAAANGLENHNDRTILLHRLRTIIDTRYSFLANCSSEKLFDMARWNDNKGSIIELEDRYTVKLDKAMKRRIPQLKALAVEKGITIDY